MKLRVDLSFISFEEPEAFMYDWSIHDWTKKLRFWIAIENIIFHIWFKWYSCTWLFLEKKTTSTTIKSCNITLSSIQSFFFLAWHWEGNILHLIKSLLFYQIFLIFFCKCQLTSIFFFCNITSTFYIFISK